MRNAIQIAVIVAALLVLSGSVGVQAAQPVCRGDTQLSGGSYRLIAPDWSIGGAAQGGDYMLAGPDAVTLRGNGCCCTYLPSLLR